MILQVVLKGMTIQGMSKTETQVFLEYQNYWSLDKWVINEFENYISTPESIGW